MKKILLVANVAKEHVLKFHIPTIKMLKECGMQIDVACAGDENIPYCDNQYKMSYKRTPFTISTFVGFYELRKIIERNNYDIIYCHTPVGGLVARIAAKKARKSGTKLIYFAHGFHFYKGAPLHNWLIFLPIEKYLSKYTDEIITLNDEDYISAKKFFCNIKIHKVHGVGCKLGRFKVENPSVAREKIRKELNIPQNAFVMIYVAELIPNKNQGVLIEALKLIRQEIPETYLVLAGPDHANGKFQKRAEHLNVDEFCRFLGWRNDVPKLLAASDIYTAVSIREGLGINLVEAMAAKLPVVASVNRGHMSIIQNGVNGFLVDYRSKEELVDKVIEIYKNKELKEQLVMNALDTIQLFDNEYVLKEIKRILIK